MPQPLVITIILNTNRRDDTLACLASLAQSTYQNNQIIVLDNASGDGSVAAIRAAFPAVQIIELSENLGYAGNNNVGIAAAIAQAADWVFVLNEDTILDADCIQELVRFGESDRQIGIVGPMVYHHSEPTVIQSAGGKLGRYWKSQHIAQNELDTGQIPRPHAVEWISGCAILVRRAVIAQVGAIDERFFYYWEETEWCVRARAANWQIFQVPAAKLWHKGVQRDYRPKPAVAYYNTRNQLLLFAKHRAPPTVWIVTCVQLLRTTASMSLRPKWRSSRMHRNAMVRGMFDFLRQRWGPGPF